MVIVCEVVFGYFLNNIPGFEHDDLAAHVFCKTLRGFLCSDIIRI
jgi:hypothetical protein